MAEIYLVKFYKRIIGTGIEQPSRVFSHYDYIAWDSFDGIRIRQVEQFKDIPNRALKMEHGDTDNDGSENNSDETLKKCPDDGYETENDGIEGNPGVKNGTLFAFLNERQKMCLYDLYETGNDVYGDPDTKNGALFSDVKEKDTEVLSNQPLIVFTMLRFSGSSQNTEDWDHKTGGAAADELRRIRKERSLDKLTFRIYGTLISDCVVAVFRTSRYQDVVSCLSELSLGHEPSSYPITDFYSVFGINSKNARQWNDEDIDIRIHFVAEPGLNPEHVRNVFRDEKYSGCLSFEKEKSSDEKVSDGTKDNIPLQCQFGRYDYSVFGRLKDKEKIIGLLLALSDVKEIRLVSSILYFSDMPFSGAASEAGASKPNSCPNDLEVLRKLREDLTNVELTCTNVVESMERLIIRLGQTRGSENTCHLLDFHIEHIHAFLQTSSLLLIRNKTVSKDCMDAVVMGVQAVNEVVNNVVADFYYDFDRPQREGFFLGNVSVVLLAYQKFVNRLVKSFHECFHFSETHHVIVAAYRGAKTQIHLLNHRIDHYTKHFEKENEIAQCRDHKVSVIYIPCSTLYSSYEIIGDLIHEVLHLCLPGINELMTAGTASEWWQPVYLEALIDIHAIKTLYCLNEGSENPDAGLDAAAVQYISCILKAHDYQKNEFIGSLIYYRIFLVYWYIFHSRKEGSEKEDEICTAFNDYNAFLNLTAKSQFRISVYNDDSLRVKLHLNPTSSISEIGEDGRYLIELSSELSSECSSQSELLNDALTQHISEHLKGIVVYFKSMVNTYNASLEKPFLEEADDALKDKIFSGYHLPPILSTLQSDSRTDPELSLIHTLYYTQEVSESEGADIISYSVPSLLPDKNVLENEQFIYPNHSRDDSNADSALEVTYKVSLSEINVEFPQDAGKESDGRDTAGVQDASASCAEDRAKENRSIPYTENDSKTMHTSADSAYTGDKNTDKKGSIEMQEFLADVSIQYLCEERSGDDSFTEIGKIIKIFNDTAEKNNYGIAPDCWKSRDFLDELKKHTGENSIIPKDDGNRILTCAENCVKEREKYLEACDEKLFPKDMKAAEAYLDAYTELLKAVYNCNAGSRTNMTAWILRSIFRFDAESDERASLSRTSPFVVSALYMHIRNLEAYGKCTEYEDIRKDKTLLKMYARLFASNTIFRLRRYHVYAADECRTVEMIRPGMDGSLCDVLNPKSTGSILDIRPIRLLEKLLMNYRRWKLWNDKKNLKSTEFRVAAIGNIRGDTEGVTMRINELIQTVADCFTDKDENVCITIDWYTPLSNTRIEKNYTTANGNTTVTVQLELHELFIKDFFDLAENSGSALAELINSHSLTFFLDCPQLYRQHEFVKKDTQSYYRNYIGNELTSYTEDFQQYNLENNLFNYGLINSLMTNISGQGCDPTAEYGKLIHRVDTRILQHIENTVIREKNEFRCVYLMLSSATALSDTDYNKRNIVREEHYNSKGFDIIHLDNETLVRMTPRKAGTETGGAGCLVLTLHQILKNIDRKLETDREILSAFREPKPDGEYDAAEYSKIIRQLRGIIIGVKYRYGAYEHVETSLNVRCEPVLFEDINNSQRLSEQEKEEWRRMRRESVMKLVKTVVGGAYQPCLMPRREYLTLNPRYKVDFYTALFSGAANVEDMMYLHLLRDREKVVTLKDGIEYDEELELMENELYPVRSCSDKQVYNTLLFNCDQSHINFDGRLALIRRIRDNDAPAHSDEEKEQYVEQVIGNLIQVCEGFAYKYRNLYGNLLELKEMSHWK